MIEPHPSLAPEKALVVDAAPSTAVSRVRSASRFPFALGAAVLAHVAVAAPLMLHRINATGGEGADRDAISIDVVVVPASAVESRVAVAEPSAASIAALDQDAGRETAVAETVPPVPVAAPDPIVVADARPELGPQPDVTPPREPAAVAAEVPPPVRAGGVASVGADAVAPVAEAAAVAAQGSAERYAKSVVEALGRSRPKVTVNGRRGTVKVTFAIADDGALKFARVTASSGHEALDAAALSAVQRVSFPAPPVGLSVSQLTYEIPYRFR